ncbi:MAG: nucleotidyltransferase family protein [Gemmatimonadota bacterium]|nr:MAG: nucleotidyltransferase family protein [Gemmatimonadota bacterium]
MEAMILAAGLGTRLRPLTEQTPKALIEVAGTPMLERVARRLVEAGAERLIVNVHHHADQVERFLEEKLNFGVEVLISREVTEPLETGGGLAAAADLFAKTAPFFLHNVDVISDLDLRAMYAAHLDDPQPRLATLAVSQRDTRRPLLVDERGVYGVANKSRGWQREARPPRGAVTELGFAGVHVISPEIFRLMHERHAFSIIDVYMRLLEDGQHVAAFDISDVSWYEVGNLERLERARSLIGD